MGIVINKCVQMTAQFRDLPQSYVTSSGSHPSHRQLKMTRSLTTLLCFLVFGTLVEGFIILPQSVNARDRDDRGAELDKRSPWLSSYHQSGDCTGSNGRTYRPGQSYRLDCNQCYCAEDGPICTLMVCW